VASIKIFKTVFRNLFVTEIQFENSNNFAARERPGNISSKHIYK